MPITVIKIPTASSSDYLSQFGLSTTDICNTESTGIAQTVSCYNAMAELRMSIMGIKATDYPPQFGLSATDWTVHQISAT